MAPTSEYIFFSAQLRDLNKHFYEFLPAFAYPVIALIHIDKGHLQNREQILVPSQQSDRCHAKEVDLTPEADTESSHLRQGIN